jgi:antirestriction protein ArdC
LDIHSVITDRIVAAIEANPGSWQRPWLTGTQMRRPINAETGNAYRGINILALWVEGQRHGYASPRWATYRQWASLGGQVRKGSVGATVVFYRALEPRPPTSEQDDDVPRPSLIARASTVFNVGQVDGAAPVIAPSIPHDPIAAVDAFVVATEAEIRHGGDRAYFAPAADLIRMPLLETFTGSATSTAVEAYYATLLHELTHWTGPAHRCDRQLDGRFGSDAYAMEELVAELGAAFLCADLGITGEVRADHAQYLAHWLRVLKGDKRAIFVAASKAAQAMDFLHGAAGHITEVDQVGVARGQEGARTPSTVQEARA